MQFTETALTVMKNFAGINQALIFKPGTQLKTINPTKSVMAVADIDVEIPGEACVYDMARFLSVLSLYNKPDVTFGDKAFTISEGRRKTRYVYADPSMVVAPPAKELKLPAADVEVKVSWDDMSSVIKAAGVLQLPEIAFVGADGTISLKAIDSANPSADTFGVELEGETDATFTLILKTENLKLLPLDYTVGLAAKGLSTFAGAGVTYFVAIEAKSNFKK